MKVLSKIKYLLMARFRNFENMLRIFAFHEKVNWIYFRENIFLFDGSIQKHSFCPFSSFFKICVWLSSFYKLRVRFECDRVQQNTVRYAWNVFSENRSIYHWGPIKSHSLRTNSFRSRRVSKYVLAHSPYLGSKRLGWVSGVGCPRDLIILG